MENNNVKVQAIPSHCTAQTNKIERIEIPSIKVQPKSADFTCCIVDSKPGIVYIKTGDSEYTILDLVNKSKRVVKSNWVRNGKYININRNLHDNIDGIETGEIPKRAIVNKQIDYFRKEVLPNFVKVGLPQIKNRVIKFIEVMTLEGGESLVNRITTEYTKICLGEELKTTYIRSKTLGMNLDYLDKFQNYMHSNGEFMYSEFVSMFVYFCQNVPSFLNGYSDRDLEYMYTPNFSNVDLTLNAFDMDYKLLNDLLHKVLTLREASKPKHIDFEDINSYKDTIKEMQLVLSFTDEEGSTKSTILNEVKVNTAYIKDNILSISFYRDDVDMITNIIGEPEVKDVGSCVIPKSVRASMQVRDIEDDDLCYAEVELDFTKVNLFQYCSKTGALLVKEDYIEELYKPVLLGE